MSPPFSLIIPAFNEAERLPATLELLSRATETLGRQIEIIVVDDGSRDGTAAAAVDAGVRVVQLPENRGKGVAVSAGVRAARYDVIAFMDADCPYEIASLAAMLDAIETGECEVAIGARELASSQINRGYGMLRRLSGKAFSFLTWLAIGLPFRDSQCGLKVFRADVAKKLFAMRTIDGFGFDFEILAAALENGDRVERFPVRLTHSDDSRIDLLADSLRMASDLLRVRRALRRRAYEFKPDSVEVHSCPLCGSEDFEPRVAKNGYRMVECRSCALWYLNPAPTDAALESVYGEDYFANSDSLSAGYLDYGERAEEFRALFRYRLSLLPKRVAGGRLLDVGAGFGYLLDAAKPSFRELWAVESSSVAAAEIRATKNVLCGDFMEVALPSNHFDVVSLQDCFEHLRSPRATLARIREVLRPDGVLLIVTPNVQSLLARIQRRGWVSLKFPEHLALYSRGTLQRALELSGFRVESMTAAGQYATLDFIAARALAGYPSSATFLARWVARLGGKRLRLWVGAGSLLVMATPATSAVGHGAPGQP